MAFARGNPKDYENWANITDEPLWKYDNVLKYFKKSEHYDFRGRWDDQMNQYHGKDGPLNIATPSYTGMAKYFVQAGREVS